MLIETVVCFNCTVYQEKAAVNIPKIQGIALRKHCNLSKLEFRALSFDHKPVAIMILLRSFFSETRQFFYYKRADWPLFRSALD
jgi:hypothetical protein